MALPGSRLAAHVGLIGMTLVHASDDLTTGNEAGPRRAAAAALGSLLILAVVPLLVWHRVLSDTLRSFHWSVSYVTAELVPWLALLSGIAFLVPVALSAGRDPESRLYPRARRAYFAWGVVLYLLGTALAVQVADVWSYAH